MFAIFHNKAFLFNHLYLDLLQLRSLTTLIKKAGDHLSHFSKEQLNWFYQISYD